MERVRTEQNRKDLQMPSNLSNSCPVSCLCQSQKLLVSAFINISARAGTGTEQSDTGDRPVAPVEPLALTLPFAGASKWCLGYMPYPSGGGKLSVSSGSGAG